VNPLWGVQTSGHFHPISELDIKIRSAYLPTLSG
jgi:hypothetical protein